MRVPLILRPFALRVRWIALALLLASAWYCRRLWRDTDRQRINLYSAVLPTPLANHLADKNWPEPKTHRVHPSLFHAPWAGSWAVPELTAPRYENGTLVSPALLMLHVMSTPSAAGTARRAFLRDVGVLNTVPPEFRHLVELSFVLGYPEDGDKWTHRAELDAEQAEHGDLFFLHGLVNGENMNEGKTVAWMEAVPARPRTAQFVIKCDEDTLVLLPNLLDWLVSLDPAHPTYFGTSLTRWYGHLHYFEGMMYGFSWGVIQTVSAANLPSDWAPMGVHEDTLPGELMPGVDPATLPDDHTGSRLNMTVDPPLMQDINYLRIPPNPDPRTGLYRLDLTWRVADWGQWWVSGPRSAIAYHRLKSDDDYRAAWDKVKSAWRWRPFIWHPPREMLHLRDPDAPQE